VTTVWFIVGLIVGGNLGMLLMAILVIAKEEEENAQSRRNARE
jgi:hypothetical protein